MKRKELDRFYLWYYFSVKEKEEESICVRNCIYLDESHTLLLHTY